ncbi:rhodanese-related sulfurtransferase [Altererythrobacter sp. ZODW24]|uniref:oxygen-dependent tRNA uridine(34) hydroxylase TrhO n=1 Tax=Altererythrobacter sp. ZODW24 TaxID=2185142 RepID=UPI000DF813C9|nr:rhodanese-related sulfurtransferase [Altererythrobacter sp. ZODW24]
MTVQTSPICVAALYKFAPIGSPPELRAELQGVCDAAGLKGTLLVAPEGINGTLAGDQSAIDTLLEHLRAKPEFADLEVKFSGADEMPFYRMKVRLKREIVTMGQPNIDPTASVGQYVSPQDWNALISDPDTIMIDTRNDYETAVGTFSGAIDPELATFRDFPAWFRAERERLLGEGKAPKVAMFCTGGIRCEKSTAFLKSEGVEDVFHLKGGILKYLENVPEDESLWEGECFVFDQRVTVKHGLETGSYDLCHACRRPISAEDKASPQFEEGVQCAACYDERTDEQRERYRERQRQEEKAAQAGEAHLGAEQKPKK